MSPANCVFPRMQAACASRGIEFIPATELTAEISGIELHLLGYFLDPENPELLESMHSFQEGRQERGRSRQRRRPDCSGRSNWPD